MWPSGVGFGHMSHETEPATQPVHEPPGAPRWPWIAAVVGPVVFWVVVLVFGAVRPGYSAVGQGISGLGAVGAPFAVVQRVNFVLLGASVLAFAFGLDHRFRDGWRPWVGVALLGILGLGVIGSGVFPSNPADRASTTELLHGIASIVGFHAGLIGVPLTTWRLSGDRRWSAYGSRWVVLGVTAVVVGAFGLFLYLGIGETGYHGVGQRLFVAVLTGWVVYHAATLLAAARANR